MSPLSYPCGRPPLVGRSYGYHVAKALFPRGILAAAVLTVDLPAYIIWCQEVPRLQTPSLWPVCSKHYTVLTLYCTVVCPTAQYSVFLCLLIPKYTYYVVYQHRVVLYAIFAQLSFVPSNVPCSVTIQTLHCHCEVLLGPFISSKRSHYISKYISPVFSAILTSRYSHVSCCEASQ